MQFLEIVMIAIGLAMDAFAVSICKSLSIKKTNIKSIVIIALYFGIFQAFMPILGYNLGKSFESYVVQIDHWITFILLSFIGINMIREAFNNENQNNEDISYKTMLPLAIATSIDALAVGITYAFLNVNIVISSTIIGVTTFIISGIGVIIGGKIGNTYGKKAEFIGGLMLIFIGIKILIEHLQII